MREARTLDWPPLPEVGEPTPRELRRAWGKVPHAERYRRQRRDLLRAAARLVSERGYQGTRVSDIVAEAGLSKATFYEHFASKEECFVELYRRTNAAMLRAGIAAAEASFGRGPEETVLAVVRALTSYVAQDPRLAEALRAELGASQPAIAAARRENQQRIVDFLVVVGGRLGSPLDPEELRLVCTVLFQGVTAVLSELRGGGDPDRHLRAIARMASRALGLTGRGGVL